MLRRPTRPSPSYSRRGRIGCSCAGTLPCRRPATPTSLACLSATSILVRSFRRPGRLLRMGADCPSALRLSAGSLPLLNHLRTLLKAKHKKTYTVAVGKLNPAKLANFAEVECFVLVACGENTLVDSKVRPILLCACPQFPSSCRRTPRTGVTSLCQSPTQGQSLVAPRLRSLLRTRVVVNVRGTTKPTFSSLLLSGERGRRCSPFSPPLSNCRMVWFTRAPTSHVLSSTLFRELTGNCFVDAPALRRTSTGPSSRRTSSSSRFKTNRSGGRPSMCSTSRSYFQRVCHPCSMSRCSTRASYLSAVVAGSGPTDEQAPPSVDPDATAEQAGSASDDDDDQPIFSTITGTYRHPKRYGATTTTSSSTTRAYFARRPSVSCLVADATNLQTPPHSRFARPTRTSSTPTFPTHLSCGRAGPGSVSIPASGSTRSASLRRAEGGARGTTRRRRSARSEGSCDILLPPRSHGVTAGMYAEC